MTEVKAYVSVLTSNEKLFHAIIVYLGTLGILSAIPFYPLVLVPFISLIPAYIAFSFKPAAGIIVSATLALPSFFYQSTIFAWIYLLIYAVVLFEAWENWETIALLSVIISLPFTPFPISLLGGFVYLIMLISSFYLGSKKSIVISSVSVFFILLLSALWQVDNAAYLPVKKEIYYTTEYLMRSYGVSIFDFGDALFTSISNVFNFSQLLNFADVLSTLFNDIIILFSQDTGILQIIAWAIPLFIASYIPGRVRGRWVELKASLSLLLIPLFYTIIYYISGVPYKVEIIVYTLLSIGVIGFLEYNGFRFSRELEIRKSKEAKEFGKFGLKELTLSKGESGLEDVGGYDDVKKELYDAIMLPLTKPDIAYAYGIKPPRGILLFGPPGTGKTMMMRALAKEIDYPFFYVKASELKSKWFGESEKNLHQLFEMARKKAPCILFFDEIDSIGRKRSMSRDSPEASLLTALLQELDGFRDDKPIIFIGATNIPNVLDPALLRPGRIDKVIYMRLPKKRERKEIFKVKLRDLPHDDSIDFDKLAEMTERFSGADIAHVVEEAKMRAAERAKRLGAISPITMDDLVYVIKSTKPSTSLSDLELYEQFKVDFERRSGRVEEKKKERPQLTFEDVANMDEVKKALRQAIEIPLKHPELIKEMGINPPKGILLFGPPGCGKTYIVKAAAGEFSANLFTLSGADLLKYGQNKATEVLKESFNRAKENTPSILFIDEIETVAPSRKTHSPIMGQLLQEMDGVKSLNGVVVIGATNLPNLLDPAILRPGRFDKIIFVGFPDKKARKKIFEIHLGKFKDLFDIDYLASKTEGYTGADIKGICDEIKYKLLNKRLSGIEHPKLSKKEIDEVLGSRRSSVTKDMMYIYEEFMKEYGERT